ncbi:hypothetical protein C7N43_15805 [Sphingobacteriales bacterium UPWRP_1]|nr:hypothetical protein BVG80_04450 [Sphingobacteriales bacterium TSM_CSM]PSJ76073.1 hypothetical protein C7N43_15805 [Sphingobacteriales bacterium UPWRP_1]
MQTTTIPVKKVKTHVGAAGSPLLRLPVQRLKIGQKLKIEIVNGWGACSVNGCHCQAYMGNDNTCQNCGHNYTLHW